MPGVPSGLLDHVSERPAHRRRAPASRPAHDGRRQVRAGGDHLVGLRDRVADWATKNGVIDQPDVRQALGEVTAVFRVNELLNWEVARAAATGELSVGDASSSKVFAADEVQHLSASLVGVIQRHGDPSDAETKALLDYFDGQAKRNLVLTFGGGVQEVQRELIAMFGLGLPRVPR